jgi:hypothetical protein
MASDFSTGIPMKEWPPIERLSIRHKNNKHHHELFASHSRSAVEFRFCLGGQTQTSGKFQAIVGL